MWLILALLAAAPPTAAAFAPPVESPPVSAAAASPGGGPDAGIVAPASLPTAATGSPVSTKSIDPTPAPPLPRLAPAATTSVAPPKAEVNSTLAPPPREPLGPIRSIPFELRVGGLLQVEYLGIASEGHVLRRLRDMAAPLPPQPPNTPSTPFLDESTLILRRARLSAEGFVATRRLGYFVELDAGQGNLVLLEYRMRAELGHGLTLNIGQMRVPFSRSWAIRDDRLLFTERSIATDQFRYDYDIGISIDARWLDDRLALTFGGFNGGGRVLARNDNLDPMLALRLEATPLGVPSAAPVEGPTADPASVVFGATVSADYVPTPPAYGYLSGDPQPPRQLVIDANDDGLPDGITVLEAELDVKATRRGFAAEAEGYYRHEAWHDIPLLQPPITSPFSPRTNYGGFFAQAFQSFARSDVVVGARVSFTELSPLGSAQHGSAHCGPFFNWYNHEHCQGAIGLLTPHDVHYGLADQRVAARARVLVAAHLAHPERFPAGVPTPPPPPTAVWINPPPLTSSDVEEAH